MAQISLKKYYFGLWSVLFIATAHAQTEGNFWQQTRWNLLQRTVYEQRDYLHGARSNGGRNASLPRNQRSDYAKEWGYGLMGSISTGFTPGVVGFGLDAHLFAASNLAGDDWRVGKIRMLPLDSQGYAQSKLVRGGVALKAKIAQTTLRIGEQRAKSPIFSSSDTRLLPETMYGWHLTSQDWASSLGLTLHAAHYSGSTDRHARSTRNPLTVNYLNPATPRGNTFDMVGAQWQGERLLLSAWLGRFKDTWNTGYLSANYTLPLADQQSLNIDGQIYRSTNTGAALAGRINNTTSSVMLRWKNAAHTVTLGWQKVHGNTPFDYVTRGAIWLGNAAQLADFNAPHEQSWQLRYEVDATALFAGLRAGVAYIRGSGIDGSRVPPNGGYAWLGYGSGGKHWERDMWLRYTVASGSAKGLALLLRYGEHRANAAQAELDTRQIRLALEYPIGN